MFLGLDFGTTGARACVVDKSEAIVHEQRLAYPEPKKQTPLDWREGLLSLLRSLPVPIATQLHGIVITATSGTSLLCNDDLIPVSPALL